MKQGEIDYMQTCAGRSDSRSSSFCLIRRWRSSAPAVGRLRVLELGCGFRKTPGASGVDVIPGSQADRAALLAALQSVDLVTIFDEKVPLPVLEIVRPDVYVKGGDYDIENVPEARLIRSWGGAVHATPFAHDRSTSRLLTRIREVRS